MHNFGTMVAVFYTGLMMKQFLDVDVLSPTEVMELIQRAFLFKKNTTYPQYPHITSAHLFYEHSTRTRISFELAAKKLGLTNVSFDAQGSSESKGEVIEDTLSTLAAMGVRIF